MSARPIEAAFEDFAESCLSVDISADEGQMNRARTLFYAGATAFCVAMTASLEELNRAMVDIEVYAAELPGDGDVH